MKTIVEFDESVSQAEAALVVRDWPLIDAALDRQHRLTHALANLLEETHGQRPPAFTTEVNRRLILISERRAEQLSRLVAFNHLVKQRLTMISRAREMRRVNVDSQPVARILNTMQ
jgi:hypothetical protein